MHRGRTGIPLLDNVLDDLPSLRCDLWVADYPQILANCHWVNGEGPSTATLQWKTDAPNKLAHSEGDAVICFIGTVSSEGLTLAPDASWQVS
jgi:hypothetical protein